MRWYKPFFIICTITIISLSLIIFLFENEDKFLDSQLVELRNKVNLSNGDRIIKCYDGGYAIIRDGDYYICDFLNKNITVISLSLIN